MRGECPIVICPARRLDKFRLPSDWKSPLAAGRLLVLSCFTSGPHRATIETAHRRNEIVAALASEISVFYATPGGQLESLVRQWQQKGRSVTKIQESIRLQPD